MVAILINQGVKVASLSICGQPILIAKKGKTYYYLGIFLSTKELFKLSVAKAHVNVCFFVNVVLRKAVTNKQFSYLVSAVLQPILNILGSGEFSAVKNKLHDVWLGFFEIFTNGSLKNFGSTEVTSGAAAYFPAMYLSIGVAVWGLLLSTMTKLQAVALSLECVLFLSTVVLHLDSQAAINACDKDFSMSWVKVKGHSGISGNVKADLAAGTASGSPFSLLAGVREHFLVVEDTSVSSNACHFVRDIFHSVCCAHWKAGPGFDVVSDVIIVCINWVVTALSVLASISGSSASAMLQVLSQCFIDVELYALVCKEFVLDEWYKEACCVFNDKEVAVARIANFVRFVVELHHAKV
ncbi:hypothetical protein G9A89_017241 [Geosiphon pyriformis]|nr:hypothetical protein G9A89_017241 [Geosiphon pyriformis]